MIAAEPVFARVVVRARVLLLLDLAGNRVIDLLVQRVSVRLLRRLAVEVAEKVGQGWPVGVLLLASLATFLADAHGVV